MNHTNQLSVRQLGRFVSKLHINSGDILAIKAGTPGAKVEIIEALAKGMEYHGINALVIVVDDFSDLKVLNETEMNKRGWFRLQSLRRLMPVKPEAEKEAENGQ